MDLSQLNVVELANNGMKVELLYPFSGTNKETGEEFSQGDVITDKKGEPFYITTLGSDSDTYRSALKRKLETRINKTDKKKTDLDHEERKAAELLAKCATGCYFVEDGKAVTHSLSEMIRIYLKYPWIREQIESTMGDRSALMKS